MVFKIVVAKLSNVSLQSATDRLDNLNSVPTQVIDATARPKTEKIKIQAEELMAGR